MKQKLTYAYIETWHMKDVAWQIQWGKNDFLGNVHGEMGYPHRKQSVPCLAWYPNINSRCIKALHVKAKTLILFEKHIEN